jgi:hypothetical protein
MIKNITYAFVLFNLISSLLYMPARHPISITPDEYLLLLQEPIAVDDEYETNQDETLSVEAPGVMENDDFGLSEVSSILVDASLHPEISLNPDGSFVYIPEEDFVGIYSFTYQLEHGDEFSDPAVVQISVLDTQPPQVEWIAPVNDEGIIITGFLYIQLEADATDNGPLAFVRFYRWDKVLKSYVDIAFVETAPYKWEIYTGDLNFQWNQIFVEAYDVAGNVSERARILLWVNPPPLYLPILFLDSETLEP